MQVKNREFSLLKTNIIYYLDSKGISKSDFYTATGVSNGVLSQGGGMSEDNLMRFLNIYTDVNIEWLLRGKGEMLLENKNGEKGYAKNDTKKVVEEPYACPGCVEKKKEINDLRENINDLRKHIALLELGLGKSLKSDCG